MDMLKKVRETIENHSMLASGDHLLVAVSGGADSVCLLRVLLQLADEYRLRLTVAHLNHGLRGSESDAEELFVRRLSAELGVEALCETVDIGSLASGKGRSQEEVGREERYRFLEGAARRCGAGKIATGHHRGDQAETVLMNLLRGSGPEGLKGILPVRSGRIIRPLLEVDRAEIVAYLRRTGSACMTDSSNLSPLFLRNRIRAELIPELRANYNPRLVEALCHTAGIIRREDDYLKQVVRRVIDGWGVDPGAAAATLPVADLCGLHEALQGRIVKLLLETAAPSQNGISHRHIAAVLALSRKAGGRSRSLDLPFGIRVEKEGGTLRIQKGGERGARGRERKPAPPPFEYRVTIPATIHLKEIDRTVHFEWIEKPTLREMKEASRKAFMDYERIYLPLILRSAAPGERVDLLGGGGKKKLKEYFIDGKVPRGLRKRIPLLVDAQSVVWVAGERISERVRVTGETKKVLKAEMV